MKRLLTLILLLLTISAHATIKTETITYKIGDQKFKGYIAWPEKMGSETKTVLIVHEWWGLNDYPKSRARQLAEMGMIAFCIDMYGKGLVVNTPDQAKEQAGKIYRDPNLLNERFLAGYAAAIKQEGVNPNKMVAIGYCFGGSVVLNAAKMDAPLDAVVSFHGGLTGVPVDAEKLNAAVLVCNGAADSFVPQADIDSLQAEMTRAGGDYTFINYEGATHAFTNPESTETGKKFNMPIEYNAAADKKSWEDFLKFIEQKVK